MSDVDGGNDLDSIMVFIGGGSPLNLTGNDFIDEMGRTIGGTVLEDTDDNNSGNSLY